MLEIVLNHFGCEGLEPYLEKTRFDCVFDTDDQLLMLYHMIKQVHLQFSLRVFFSLQKHLVNQFVHSLVDFPDG